MPRLSIASVMKLTALVAVDLALVGGDTWWLLGIPVILILVVALNLALVQVFLLRRPLRAFHYTFMAVGMVSSIAFSVLVSDPNSLGVNVAIVWQHRGANGVAWLARIYQEDYHTFRTILGLGAGFLTLLTAWASGLLVAWVMRRRCQRLGGEARSSAPVVAGALAGFGLATISSHGLFSALRKAPVPFSRSWYAFLGSLAAGAFLGGLAVWLSRHSQGRVLKGPLPGPGSQGAPSDLTA